jgi:hypothetical protein
MPFQKVEFEFPSDDDDKLEIEVESSSAEPMKKPGKAEKEPEVAVEIEDDEDDVDVEVVDDTPPADRGRKPSDPPEEVTDEELEEYSDKVRKRIKHFSKGYHDERRAKEAAMREKQELERLAQQLFEENKKLKTSSTKSQAALIEQAKRSAAADMEQAKASYKAAYDSGDSNAALEAQEKLTTARLKLEKVNNLRVPTLQENEIPVQVKAEPAPAPQVDQRAMDWKNNNPWFQTDDEMTSFALGLHNKLVKQGVSPQSDTYYESIDTRMRQVFPDQFEDTKQRTPEPKRKTSVVAPATRSTAPNKVTLTRTQVQIAKRLGLTPEQYAKQVAIDMRKQNG